MNAYSTLPTFRKCFVMLLAILVGSVTVSDVRSQTAFRRSGKIAFTSDRDGNHEIYVMNADGTGHTRLTNNSTVDDHPVWSPDGKRIAYVGQRPGGGFAIFVMNADGSSKTEVTPIYFNATAYPIWDAWGMSWSPDGRRIVFQETVQPSIAPVYPNKIHIVDVETRARTLLVDDPVDARQPAWSPDGSKIIFSSSRAGMPFFHHLHTVRPDGTDIRQLISNAGDNDLAPTWSPNGDKIAFQLFDYANFENVAIVNSDGSGRDWWDSGGVGVTTWGGRDKPDWSPDGKSIVFHVSLGFGGAWNTELFVKSVSGQGLTQLTETPGNNFKPSWQPIASFAASFDYDGDGRSDLSSFRAANNTWYLSNSTTGYTTVQWGIAGDVSAPADFDGDGRTDIAIYRPSAGRWYVRMSATNTMQMVNWGAEGDIPVPMDRDADGRADFVLFRPSNNTWYTRFANDTFSQTVFGQSGDKPVVGDFDADGKGDLAVFRPSNSTWYIARSTAGYFVQTWGEPGDIPVTGDFDGDGASDHAVFRPSLGCWYLSKTTEGFSSQNWGQPGDIPVAADYDGDGKTDPAIFRPSNGKWYLARSRDGIIVVPVGQDGDVPTQSSFVY